MDDTKHTPGPWGLSDETVRDGLRSMYVHAAPEGLLAIVRTEHQGGYYGDANARLIAAAPELLEALRMAKETIRVWHGPNAWDIYDRASPEMKTINSAIAKAEGRHE